jgi:CheY-like chemotaxis protein
MDRPDEDPRKLLRKALNHLYNPDYLRRSPLIELVGIAGRFDAPKVLQRILIQAIDTVQYRPAGSRDERRMYYHNLLHDRYVIKLGQEEVAVRLDISLRQLAREQDHAVDILATVLAEKYPALASTMSRQSMAISVQPPDAVSADLSRFTEGAPALPLRLSHLLEGVVILIEPLARQKQATIHMNISPDTRGVLAHPVALRQALLAIIHAALLDAGKRKITLHAENSGLQVQISVKSEGSVAENHIPLHTYWNLAQRLIEMNGGQLNFIAGQNFSATMLLPGYQQSLVLALDDDPGFLHFLQQATQTSRYQVVELAKPALVLEWVETYAIAFILLDVMATSFDGWQVLKSLQQHPWAKKIPVMVCTPIVLEEIATTLGARANLRKPVTKAALLSALDQQDKQNLLRYRYDA